MVYYSKKDWWLVSLVWAGILLLLVIGVYNLIAPSGEAYVDWTFLFSCAFIVCAMCSSRGTTS